jgi:hypothetical protein
MSLSVNGSSNNNPNALWQSLLQSDAPASGSAQSDPIASLLAALGQNTGTASANASSANAPSSSTSATVSTPSGGSSPQFDRQTLQTLFDAQSGASSSQSSPAQLGNGPGDSYAPQQAQQSGGHHGHHRHNQVGRAPGGDQSGPDMLDPAGFADSGATSQTNAAAESDGSNSSGSAAASAGSASLANNNLLERLIQMQAQLTSATTPQNIATV